MGRFDGKIAFVTGAARGQGRSHALALARDGADIIAVDYCHSIGSVPYDLATEDDLAETVHQIEAMDRRVHSEIADVRRVAQLRQAAEAGVAELGGIDIVLCNAGIFSSAPPLEMSEEIWDDMIDVNLSGVFRTMQATFPYLMDSGRGGSVVATISVAGLRGSSGNSMHYGAAKFALQHVIQSMALFGAPKYVRVNGVAPTNCNTDMLHSQSMYDLFRPDLKVPTAQDVQPAFESLQALPNLPFIEPQDTTNAILWLCSDEARYITGAILPVDGGAAIKH